MDTMIIASTVHKAHLAGAGMELGTVLFASPRSVRMGAGRGCEIETIHVHESAWPLPNDILDLLEPLNAPVLRLS